MEDFEDTEGQEDPVVDAEIVQRARMMGHVPKEEFRGDPDKWIDERTYVERADRIMPILKSTNKALETKLSAAELELQSTKKEMENLRKTVEGMVKVSTKIAEDTYKTRMNEIKSKQFAAAAEGDEDTWTKLEEQKTSLVKPDEVITPQEETPSGEHPDFRPWVNNNQWYYSDVTLRNYADSVGEFVKRMNPGLDGMAFFDAVKQEVIARYPDHKAFEEMRKPKPSYVDNGGSGGFGGGERKETKGKTFSDLPEDAKNQCKILMSKIPGYTKETYVRDYFEQE